MVEPSLILELSVTDFGCSDECGGDDIDWVRDEGVASVEDASMILASEVLMKVIFPTTSYLVHSPWWTP